MEQKKDEQRQQRRKYSPRGEQGQKMVAFRLDSDLLAWLSKQANKGRYINNLIRAHMDDMKCQRWSNEQDADEYPSDLHDYQP